LLALEPSVAYALGDIAEGLDVNARRGLDEACRVFLDVADQAPAERGERSRAVGEVPEGGTA
jgi:hypothetical protein